MSSLLKMNQKFLSKSSWTIRGNNSNLSTPNNNENKTNNVRISKGTNNRLLQFHNGDKAQTIDVKRDRKINEIGTKQMQYNQSGERAQMRIDEAQAHARAQLSPINGGVICYDQNSHHKTPVKSSNYRSSNFRQNHIQTLVNYSDSNHHPHNTAKLHANYHIAHQHNQQYQQTNSSSFGLRRTKGMSHSITDLRELKEKKLLPKKNQDNDDDGFQREIFERRIDTYIAEIEMDPLFHLGSTIRAIYDGDEQNRFMEKLDARIKNHDKDIERMCNCHYQGFVDCIHELLKVRPQAAALKSEINQVNVELKNSSENIVRKADELIKYRRVLCNTKIAIDHLQECLPVLETFTRLMNQMNEKKYYPALKTLEQFETLYLPKFKKYRFAQSMCSRVPKIRETIENESVKDLKDFLENIRKSTSKIGEIALRNTALSNQSTDYVRTLFEYDSIWLEKWSEQISTNRSDNGVSQEDFGFISNELSAPDIVDFSPVYRCLHIFGCLGSREQFEHYYRLQRRQQAKLIFQFNSNNLSLFTGDGFRNYLFSVVGFFVIEDHLLNTSNGLVTKQYLAENWDEVIKALVKNVQEHASECKDSKQMIHLKSLLMIFCHTVHSYGYCTDEIIKLLSDLRQIYIDILQADWTEFFEKIFDSDNYHPLIVENDEQYRKIFAGFPLLEMESLKNDNEITIKNDNKPSDCEKIEFPKRFPFSSMVTEIYKAVREFIVQAIQFSNDLNVSLTDTEDMIRSSTNLLLTKTLSDALQSLIKKPNLGLLQLIQISINLNYLEEASVYLKTHINEQITQQSIISETSSSSSSSSTTGGGGSGSVGGSTTGTIASASSSIITSKIKKSNIISSISSISDNDSNLQIRKSSLSNSNKISGSKFINSNSSIINSGELLSNTYLTELKGKTMFAEARSDAESQIYTQLHCKVEEFFDLANYDFLMTELTGKASQYILDLIAFLRSTFEAFTNLPPRVAQTACLSSSKFISSKLIDILKDENVKAFSQAFLDQFNLDLVQCEMYADSEPVPNFNEGTLSECFYELRQVMDLLTADSNWSIYFAEYGKNESRYLRVPPHLALSLLEKQIKGEQKKGVFSTLSKNERDKKNRYEFIVRKLKDLIASNNSAN